MYKDPFNREALFQALSLMIVHTSMEQKEFVARLRHALVHTAKKEFPEASIAQISQKIGMGRGTIAEYLDCEHSLKIAPSNEMHILNDLWKIKDEDHLVDVKGPVSFYAIARKQLVGKHSPKTALNTLTRSGSVVHHGDNKLLIKSPRMTIGNDEKQLARIISRIFLNLVETVLHNTKTKDKNYQNMLVTTSVPSRLIPRLHHDIFEYIKCTTMIDLRSMIEAYEDQENDHYQQYSVSIIEHFLTQLR